MIRRFLLISIALLSLGSTLPSMTLNASGYPCRGYPCVATGCTESGEWGPAPGTGVRVRPAGMIAAVHPEIGIPCGSIVEITLPDGSIETRWVIDRAGPDVPVDGIDRLMTRNDAIEFGRSDVSVRVVGRRLPMSY